MEKPIIPVVFLTVSYGTFSSPFPSLSFVCFCRNFIPLHRHHPCFLLLSYVLLCCAAGRPVLTVHCNLFAQRTKSYSRYQRLHHERDTLAKGAIFRGQYSELMCS